MSHYLQVCAGAYQILLDADGIHEILDLDNGDGTQAAGHRDWRGQALTSINGRTLLGMKDDTLTRERSGVVYSAGCGDAPLMLEFDRVARLRHVGEASLHPLPSVPERVRRLFDGVFPDKESGAWLYHLRRPLDPAVLLEQPTAQLEPVMPLEQSTEHSPPTESATEFENTPADPAEAPPD